MAKKEEKKAAKAPTKLTEKQKVQVRAMRDKDDPTAAAKAAALAAELRKKNDKKAKTGGSGKVKPDTGLAYPGLGVDKETGQISPQKAIGDVIPGLEDDFETNFRTNNPNQEDVYGNRRNISRDEEGNVTIGDKAGGAFGGSMDAFLKSLQGFSQNGPLDLSGAPQILQTGDVRQESERAADANYNYITKNYGKQKAQEMESAKQELANRGIPMDPDPNSLYGKTLREIDNKYQEMDDQAKNQGITKSNETLGALIGGQGIARDSFVSGAMAKHGSDLGDVTTFGGMANQFAPNFQPYQGGSQDKAGTMMDLLKTISGADLAKFGIDQDTMVKLRQLDDALKAKAKGGGGGGGGDKQDTPGISTGPAPGF